MQNPDFKQYMQPLQHLTQKGQRTFIMYLMMTHPWNSTALFERAEETFKKIKIPSTRVQELMLIPTSSIGSARSTISRM